MTFFFKGYGAHRDLHPFPTRRSSDLSPRALRRDVNKLSSTIFKTFHSAEKNVLNIAASHRLAVRVATTIEVVFMLLFGLR